MKNNYDYNEFKMISYKVKELSELLGKEIEWDPYEWGILIPSELNDNSGYWCMCSDSDDLYNTIFAMINGIRAYKYSKGI